MFVTQESWREFCQPQTGGNKDRISSKHYCDLWGTNSGQRCTSLLCMSVLGTSVSQECLFLMNGCLLLSFCEWMRRVHHLPKNNQYSQFALLGSVQLCHFTYELVHAPALSGWEASIVQQDTIANINVVFPPWSSALVATGVH